MWECKHCKKAFDFTRTTEKANHSRHCDQNPKKQDSYKKLREKADVYYNNKFGEYEVFTVTCATCDKEFTVKERALLFPKKENYYCSRSCSNSVGGKVKNLCYRPDELSHYRTVCFRYHEKQCVVCGEDKIVAVHHLDHNHKNNDPNNLVPLCPTHHQYVHSKFKHLVMPDINKYLKNRKK